MEYTYIHTPLGIAEICGDRDGLRSITVMDKEPEGAYPEPRVLKSVINQLEEYFKGERSDFDLKLNPQGTPFQKMVWDHLLEIPFGTTISYLDLAKKIGDVNAIRAVAAANGKNPIWIVIPCHRVIGSDGSLTGYAGGLHRKKWLINHECPVKQTQLF